MKRVLDWLLGLDSTPDLGGGELGLRFATPPAPWIMLSGAIIAAALIWLVYRREAISRGARWFLGCLRLIAVLLVLFILGQPQLVLRRTIVDPSCVALLLDRSGSMALRDGSMSKDAAQHSRWQDVVSTASKGPRCLLQSLPAGQQVRGYAFDGDIESIASAGAASERSAIARALEQMRPEGAASDIAAAVERVLADTTGERLAAVVLLSDGRRTAGGSASRVTELARRRSVPIHVVAAGSGAALRDVRLESAWCEDEVFVNDIVLVRVRLRATGYAGTVPVELQLTDQGSGERIASRSIRLASDAAPEEVEVAFRPARPGRRLLRVTAEAGGGDAVPDNQSAELVVRARDEKIGVLYVEGDPRFEYRYLKNLLLREATIESSCLLLGASAGFAQEGTRPIRQFPQSVEELRGYDVIILGDVDPRGDWASPTQLTLLSDHIQNGGAGLIFLSGEKCVPRKLRGSPLEKLLPVRVDDSLAGSAEGRMDSMFTVQLTPEGRSSGLFRFDVDADGPSVESLPGWYWSAGVLGPQPACSVLAVNPAAGDLPLVVMGRAGEGRTLYVGSDDVWRWRRFGGEHYYDAFWMQAIRTMARGRKLGQRGAWRLESDRRQIDQGEQAELRLRPVDLATRGVLPTATVEVADVYGGLVEKLTLSALEAGNGYAGAFVPSRPGAYVLTASPPDGSELEKRPTFDLRVTPALAERIRPEADHEYLRALAAQTDGVLVRAGGDLRPLLEKIPDRRVEHADDLEEPIWDKPFMLLLFAGVLAAEWITRKLHGLP